MSSDKFHDECGVVGIHMKNREENCASYIYYGLFALQHRGQESAGISVNKRGKITTHKDTGLVPEVFAGSKLKSLKGNIGVGHVRYSTSGEGGVTNAQPLTATVQGIQIALAHNGNLVNDEALRRMLENNGVVFQTTIDTEVMVDVLAQGLKDGIVKAIQYMVEIIKGAYALVITMEDKLIGVRDPYGLRPICLGKKDDMMILASESCAIEAMGGELIRDLDPGEIVIIDENGVESYGQNNWVNKKTCIFEQVYFARPDSVMEGRSVYQSRHAAGRILAKESPIEADVVIGVPDSGIPAAIGYAEESGIPYGLGLIKNKYIARTFIQPTQKLREEGVRLKLTPLKDTIEGKRVIIIDDSIVRGTTSKRLVEILRTGGAKEVHFRVTSPPVAHSCHFGIDTPRRKYLIGAKKSVEKIRDILGADSLAYISLAGLSESVGGETSYCKACFDGDYPMEVPIAGSGD